MSTQPGARCYIHGHREATAQCYVCHSDLCEFCTKDHLGEPICRSCLAEINAAKLSRDGKIAAVVNVVWLCLALLDGFLFFVFSGGGDIEQVNVQAFVIPLVFIVPIGAVVALWYALADRNYEKKQARELRTSMALFSALVLIFGGLGAYIPGVALAAGIPQVLVILLLGFACGCCLSFLKGVSAATEGIRPNWAVVLAVIPPVVGLVMAFYAGFACSNLW